MAFCEKCGSPLDADARFCSTCGAPVVEPVPTIRFCAGCGAQLEADARFCMNCGLAIDAPAVVTVHEDGPAVIIDVANVDALWPTEPEPEPEPEPEAEEEFDFPLPSLEQIAAVTTMLNEEIAQEEQMLLQVKTI